MSPTTQPSERVLGPFQVAMITTSAVIALRNLPMMAGHGVAAIFFYTLSALVFLIPISLVCAELASGWPDKGGVYLWVQRAFGFRAANLSVWLHWMESVIWLPTVLTFLATTLAYMYDPALAQNKAYVLTTLLVVLWGSTLLNFRGMKTSGWVSSLGVTFGTVVPGALIIMLGFSWYFSGSPSHVEFTMANLVPEMRLTNFVFLAGVLLGFGGMEVSSYHVLETKNPQKVFPKALALAVAIILGISVLGTLAISIVVPADQIKLTTGVMQAFDYFFSAFGIQHSTPIIAGLIVLGSIALVNTWIIGPSKGLLISAEQGHMPAFMAKTNRHGIPTNILLMQAVITSVIAITLYALLDDINDAYWIMSVMAVQLFCVMYFFVFLAAIKLRYKEPHTARAFKIPGGLPMIWVVGLLGAFSSIGALLLGFLPPDSMTMESPLAYALWLLLSMVVLGAPPLVWDLFKKKK